MQSVNEETEIPILMLAVCLWNFLTRVWTTGIPVPNISWRSQYSQRHVCYQPINLHVLRCRMTYNAFNSWSLEKLCICDTTRQKELQQPHLLQISQIGNHKLFWNVQHNPTLCHYTFQINTTIQPLWHVMSTHRCRNNKKNNAKEEIISTQPKKRSLHWLQ